MHGFLTDKTAGRLQEVLGCSTVGDVCMHRVVLSLQMGTRENNALVTMDYTVSILERNH